MSAPGPTSTLARPVVAFAALAVAAFLFGVTFVVVKDAVKEMPPIGFVGWRFLLGAGALLAVARPRSRAVWKDGVVAGIFLFGGYALQTQGLITTSASNSGLITGIYVVLTPLVAAMVLRRAPRLLVVAGTVLAFSGLAALTLTDGLRLQQGDLLTVGCAFSFAAHIVYLSRVARRHRVIPFTAVQLLVTATLGLAWSTVSEGLPSPGTGGWIPLLVTGLAVSAGAFLLQVWAQTVVGPSRTAVVLSLEPAFAAASGAALLGERLSIRGWVGAALILAGIYVVLAAAGPDDELPVAESLTAAH